MQITIHDDACRAAVLFAVWHHAWLENEEELYNRLDVEAHAVLDGADTRENYAVLVEQAALLIDTFADAQRVRTATVGDTVGVTASVDGFRGALERCAERIAEDEAVWKGSEAARAHLLSVHDAAVRLLAELPEPAKAVA
jgi:hypothetical protein